MPQLPDFPYDVFLCHSAKDKAEVRKIAERLRKDGVRVWFDEWALKPGDSIPAKIEEGLERSRVLVLCMSENAFGSDWAQLESYTFRFRDPLNKERRFLPLRLDDSPIKGSLAQFLYINWLPEIHEQEYAKLLEASQSSTKLTIAEEQNTLGHDLTKAIQLDYKGKTIMSYAFSPDGKHALTGGSNNAVQLWEIETGKCLREFNGHTRPVRGVTWSTDQNRVVSVSEDKTVRQWDIKTGQCVSILGGSTALAWGMAWGLDDRWLLTSANIRELRFWQTDSGTSVRLLKGYSDVVADATWSVDKLPIDQRRSYSAHKQKVAQLWDLEGQRCLCNLVGHTGWVYCLAWSHDQRHVITGSADKTVRLWSLETERCLQVFEGHTDSILAVEWNKDQRHVLSGSMDLTVRLWDTKLGHCVVVLDGHVNPVLKVAWSVDGRRAFSADDRGSIWTWDLSQFLPDLPATEVAASNFSHAPNQAQYTNAKVLLVGESGVGKTGLSKRLAADTWEPSDSTVGAWSTQWKLPVISGEGMTREIWLWDFGGQADQRLIHQLYMDETALVVLVFDGQKEDLFETLGQWDRDLSRASRKQFAKLLIAGRVDAGGLRVSRSEVLRFASERKFQGFLETSAKRNIGCEELKQAILATINWDELPCRTTEVLFKRLKDEIIALKDNGRVLMRFNELRVTLQLRLSGELARFTDAELRTVLTLLAGPGVVWELAFGSWVLLQPERINAYAQAVIRTLQADEHQRGCLMEELVLKGGLMYESSMERLEGDEERFVLLAMHQTLVERGLCLRQPTIKGNLLVFPSYYRKEREDIVEYPSVQVNYRFTGFLDEIYATLVVRLHHSDAFQQDALWRYAADFKTNTKKQLGVKLTRRAPAMGDLEVYFDTAVSMEEKIIFSKYVHEHLLQHASDVERLRHYVCLECGTPVGNRDIAMKRLDDWLQGGSPQGEKLGLSKSREGKDVPPTIICVNCEERVMLFDEMEQCFASEEIQQRVRDMQEEVNIELDNESKERALVGEVISTVANAGQLSREFNVSDHGIDLEIEFKTEPRAADKPGEATGEKLYLQLKSGDSYTRKRKSDGAEIFTIKKPRHAEYWMIQKFPVLLVVRNSEGEVRWMEVRDYLKRESDNGKKAVKQIIFTGERFDVMSVRRWRKKLLSNGEKANL